MGTRIRATLYLLFGLWWIIAMAATAIPIIGMMTIDTKTVFCVFLGALIIMLPGFIFIDLGLKKLRWLRSKKTSTQ